MASKYLVTLTEKAFIDLDSIYSYILETSQSKRTRDMVKMEIEKTLRSLAIFPRRNPLLLKNPHFRKAKVYSYSIVYKVIKKEKTVIVWRILSEYTDWANSME